MFSMNQVPSAHIIHWFRNVFEFMSLIVAVGMMFKAYSLLLHSQHGPLLIKMHALWTVNCIILYVSCKFFPMHSYYVYLLYRFSMHSYGVYPF